MTGGEIVQLSKGDLELTIVHSCDTASLGNSDAMAIFANVKVTHRSNKTEDLHSSALSPLDLHYRLPHVILHIL